MKNFKHFVQFAFMALLLVGVFGIYTELRQMNGMQYSTSQKTNHAVNASFFTKLNSTALPVGKDVPMLRIGNGDYSGTVVIPVLTIPANPDMEYTTVQ